jgi:hypothetical protein
LFVCLIATAQKRTPVEYKTALQFNPSVLLGADYTFMLGAEKRVKRNVGLLLDAGYIFQSSYFEPDKIKRATGISVRPAARLYMGRYDREFLQLQLFYKQVNYRMYDWLGKSCVNGVTTFEQLQNFTYRKKALAVNVMAGELFPLSGNLFLELYVGIGVKFKRQGPTEKRSCYRDEENSFLNIYASKSVAPNVPLGIKLLYALR